MKFLGKLLINKTYKIIITTEGKKIAWRLESNKKDLIGSGVVYKVDLCSIVMMRKSLHKKDWTHFL